MSNPPTIQDPENELSILDRAKKSKENLEKIATLKSQIKQQKELNKLTATKMEIGNLSHLIFFDSTNGYAKLAENSAVIYAGNVAKRIGRRVNLRQDTDNYAKSEFGVVSVKLSDELIEKLLAINITKDPEISTAHIHAFKLDKPISESYLKSLQDTLKKRFRTNQPNHNAQRPHPNSFYLHQRATRNLLLQHQKYVRISTP